MTKEPIYKPRNYKNLYNCIFCDENTGECKFNVNWECGIFCVSKLTFNPRTQLKLKRLFDETFINR